MQNNMVSIPSTNMNGGLKAANNSGTVVGVGVTGTVITNGQRVYLTPASNYHLTAAARQNAVSTAAVTTATGVGVVANAKVITASNSNSGSSNSNIFCNPNAATSVATTSSTGAVRYFSQFSSAAAVGQRKLLNGDTMVVVNGAKNLILAKPSAAMHNNNNINNNYNNSMNINSIKLLSTAAALATPSTPSHIATASTATSAITVPNGGNRMLIGTHQPHKLKPQPSIVIDDFIVEDFDDDEQEDNTDAVAATAAASAALQQKAQSNSVDHVNEMKSQKSNEAMPLLTSPINKTTIDPDAEPELDIVINNVVCSFSVRCHLKLREIALNGNNVEYRRENGMVTMKLRRPYTTASIWSSGRITCTGATSESQAKIAARRYARCLAKLGFPTHFQNFRIVNVLGTCSMPWAIKIVNFSERHRDNASYEPELHPGVTYKMREPKATLKIFSTGSITVTAASVNDVESAIQNIYPLVHEFRKQRSAEELQHLRQKQRNANAHNNIVDHVDGNQSGAQGTDNANDMFNTTAAAHKNITRPSSNTASSSNLSSMRRMDQQTHLERRQMPYSDSQLTKNSNDGGGASGSSTSSCDNICANARRRATECWATKLQNKRPRYNDPTTATTPSGGSSSRSTTSSMSNMNSTVNASSIYGGANTPFNRMRPKQFQHADLVKQNSNFRNVRNTSASSFGATATTTSAAGARAPSGYMKRNSYSPTDFHVDDLIEEDDDDMHF